MWKRTDLRKVSSYWAINKGDVSQELHPTVFKTWHITDMVSNTYITAISPVHDNKNSVKHIYEQENI